MVGYVTVRGRIVPLTLKSMVIHSFLPGADKDPYTLLVTVRPREQFVPNFMKLGVLECQANPRYEKLKGVLTIKIMPMVEKLNRLNLSYYIKIEL